MKRSPEHRMDVEKGIVYGRNGRPVGRLLDGYVCIHIGLRSFSAHRLLWESVNGPIPEGLQINHINGIKSDNRLCNLELVTPSQNLQHAYQLGLTSASGEKNGRALLTAQDVLDIRACKTSSLVLGRRYGVHSRTVRDARNGVTWKYLPTGAQA